MILSMYKNKQTGGYRVFVNNSASKALFLPEYFTDSSGGPLKLLEKYSNEGRELLTFCCERSEDLEFLESYKVNFENKLI